jgi:hypothetical protein
MVDVLRYKLESSFPCGVFEIFHCLYPSCSTMAMGSDQPLTEMSTRHLPWGLEAADKYSRQLCHLLVQIENPGSLNLLEKSVPTKACTGIATSTDDLISQSNKLKRVLVLLFT